MTPIEARLKELMDRLDDWEDKRLIWEAIQRIRSARKHVRELEDENEALKERLNQSVSKLKTRHERS